LTVNIVTANRFATLLLTNLTRPQGKTVWQSACVLQQLIISTATRGIAFGIVKSLSF